MTLNWKKHENENGFPYYVQNLNGTKQWDHPKYSEILQRIDECNYIKYPPHRLASKIRVLQQALHMDEVLLTTIIGVFERHRLGATESALYLESYDLEAVLSDIYFASNKQNYTNIDVDFATELMMNFLYSVFDKDRRNNVQVASTKLVLAILSKCDISDLYHFIFTISSDHNSCVTRLKLQSVLTRVIQITTYLHEDACFGQCLLKSTIEDCFSGCSGLVGISENGFKTWIRSYPTLLTWIPSLFRIRAAESIVHNIKCSSCKATTFTGLRYRCLKCSNYNQCQHCYFDGKLSHSHKFTHTMKEYCTEDNTRNFTQSFLKKICKVLKLSISSAQPSLSNNIMEAKVRSFNKFYLVGSTNTDKAGKIEPLSTPDIQLQVVIRQLELQNRELQQMAHIHKNDTQMKKYLEDHGHHIATQIQKLKNLKDYLKVSQPTVITQKPTLKRMESTPLISTNKVTKRGIGLDMLSPIPQVKEKSSLNEYSCTNKMISDSAIEDTIANSNTMHSYSVNDLSTWIGGNPTTSNSNMFVDCTTNVENNLDGKTQDTEIQSNLDEVLAKLQQILATNFMLDESLGSNDNGNLKNAVNEVEGMLTSLIDGVEISRTPQESSLL